MAKAPRAREFRYERKFLVDQLQASQVQWLVKLHPSMFIEPYPPRYVNNLYLDTEDMENYYANVDGAGDRRKVRVRWYGDLFGPVASPVLEVKIKRNLVGTKLQYNFAPFELDGRFCDAYFQGVLGASELPARVHAELRTMSVVLLNRYARRYYATRDGRYRVTLDTQLTFYRVARQRNSFAHRQVDHTHLVVELKYGVAEEVGAGRVARFFPFEMTKSSKYVQGIERVYM